MKRGSNKFWFNVKIEQAKLNCQAKNYSPYKKKQTLHRFKIKFQLATATFSMKRQSFNDHPALKHQNTMTTSWYLYYYIVCSCSDCVLLCRLNNNDPAGQVWPPEPELDTYGLTGLLGSGLLLIKGSSYVH